MNSASIGAICAISTSSRNPLRPRKRSRASGNAASTPATSEHATAPSVTIRLFVRCTVKPGLAIALAKLSNVTASGTRS